MSLDYAFYLALVSFSGFGLGTLMLSVLLSLKMSESFFCINNWRAVTKLGISIIVGTILFLVLPRKGIPYSPGLVTYLIGLTLVGIGGIGTCYRSIQLYVDYAVAKEIHEENGEEGVSSD